MVLPLKSFRLYPHRPGSLLPLVKSHLPHSLPIYGTIQNALRTSGTTGKDEVRAWTSFSDITSHGVVWTIIMQLPNQRQSRMYCSAERDLLPGPNFDPKPALSDPEGRRLWRKGQDFANATVDYWRERKIQGDGGKLGAVSLVWNPEVVELLGSPVNPIYDVWLSPEDSSWWRAAEEGVEKSGLVVDQCRLEDCEIIRNTREVKEEVDYYTSRMDRITVIRPESTRSGGPKSQDQCKDPDKEGAVAWVMTHCDGNLGALYTVKGYRGRGLSRWVIAAHMARLLENDPETVQAHAWTSETNKASVGLWKRLGWSKGWSGRWVILP